MKSVIRKARRGPAVTGALCGLIVAACCGQSFAVGPLASDLAAYNDGTGPLAGAWSGTSTIPAALQALRVDVDFAVFAPGTLGNSALFDLSDVQGADTEFVYVYQVHNTIGGTAALTQLTVSLGDLSIHPLLIGKNDGPDVELPSNDGWVSGFLDPLGNPTIDPALSQIAPSDIDRDPLAQGIVWEWNGGAGLPAGNVSAMLAFTSTGSPEWDLASILGGGFSGTDILPSPTAHMPEPSSLLLVLMASSMGLAARRKRRC